MKNITPAADLDPATFRPCGECALCCKALPIHGSQDLDKPAGKWCRHWANSTGCKIYENREEVCRTFFCLWKINALPEELAPLKTKCVLAIYKEGVLIVYVDPSYPTAWKEGRMGSYLTVWSERFMIEVGKQRSWVHPVTGLHVSRWRVTPVGETINVKEILG